MARVRETKVTLPCSREQKLALEQRAKQQGLNVANYLRSLLGWPLEQHGYRKDLPTSHRGETAQQENNTTNIEQRAE